MTTRPAARHTSAHRGRRTGVMLTALAVSLAVASCSGDDSEAEPTTSSAATTAPTITEPVTTEPLTTDPATTESATTDPATTEPATTEPVTTEPASGPLDDVATVVDLPDQPDGVPFPTDEWPTGELPEGVDVATLDAAAAAAFKTGMDDGAHVRSIVVIDDGELVYEAYHPSITADTVNSSFSVAKSVTSAAVGILVGEGVVPLTGPAPVAAWADPADPRHAIQVEDLLHMASGLEWLEVYTGDSAPARMLGAADASDVVAAMPLADEPNTIFNYSTGTTAVLAQILTDAAWAMETGATVDPAAEPDASAGTDFVTERIFDRIGITSAELMTDPEGTWLGGLGANMTTRDFARFGLLYMRGGTWDGAQVVPEEWVQYSFTPSDPNPGYGAQWWLFADRGLYEARGLFGQMIVLDPAHDLVIAINSEQGGDSELLADTVLAAFAAAA